ncbi:MAG: biotin transporter BioY [Candidatus Promineifilaceae bacterium]|nr:biotin transporter BioY [Candidatus Promineifilaceae bacterium]
MYLTYADHFRPMDKQRVLLYELTLLLIGSLFIALTAQVSIRIGPVPITGQTMGVLLVGMLYGSKRGAATLLLYVIEGAAGLPVFAGGTSGLTVLAGPTGGYLVGFIPAAFVVGWLAERGWDRSFGLTAVAMLIGNAVIYLFGLSRLGFLLGYENMLAYGFLPFWPGDLLKIIVAAGLLPAGWKLLDKLGLDQRIG